jgi:hypothetical protein
MSPKTYTILVHDRVKKNHVGDIYEAPATGVRYIVAGDQYPQMLVNMATGHIWSTESLFGGSRTMLKYVGNVKDLK